MFLAIDGILAPAEAAALRGAAEALTFADGRASAGRFAREIKANDQAVASDDLDAIRAKAMDALTAHPVFTAAARPKAMTPLILSRYREGQTYGMHVDDALMQGLRTDLSFTLFLSEPDSYEGGALIVADTAEERAFKLAPGSLILYPSTTLHRVEPVTRGTRLCLVGWVQSWIRDAGQREVLFDLDRAIADVHTREGKSALLDTLTKTRSNLIRMWAT
ncbi:MAG: Fe2+-dependent dioxygenase [Rhodobacterales bacterium 32-67-9]|nr:MAG: Fe2+-dependent dioxygenase [Rhodobacterales bacterium 32-67-9]